MSVTIFEQESAYLEEMHINLSNFAMVPIVGSIPAAAKALLGAIEFVVATILFLLALIPSLCSTTARRVLAFSALHIGKGLVRTVVGGVLAAPIIGPVLVSGIVKITASCCRPCFSLFEYGKYHNDGENANNCLYG